MRSHYTTTSYARLVEMKKIGEDFDKRNKRCSNISSNGGCRDRLVVGNDQTILKVLS